MPQQEPQERVRRSSTTAANQTVDEKTLANIRKYGHAGPAAIKKRLQELGKEWNIEKTLEVNASTLALTGLVLGTFVNKKWYLVPAVVTSFLLQHGLQGWCPPLPLFRKLGIRTAREINEERTALQILRGDFDESRQATPEELLQKIRKV
jgi:hypothetical protein